MDKQTIVQIIAGALAVEHLGFLGLEMFFWPVLARLAFGLSREQALAPEMEPARVLSVNQGLSNGFLAAGLAWGLWLWRADRPEAVPLVGFFFGCILLAGLLGAATVRRSRLTFLLAQALPGGAGLALLLL
jgi:putative membrane protein